MTGKRHTHANQHFVPAAGHDWLLPFYDPVWALLGGSSHLKALVARAEIEPDHNVLEIGCGTGNLTLMLKRFHPEARVVGLDPDPKALARARAKAARAAVTIELDQGFSQELPYPDASFDRVFSSFMFHHLDLPTKETTLREVGRVLVPGGVFMITFKSRETTGDEPQIAQRTVPNRGTFECHTYAWSPQKAATTITEYLHLSKVDEFDEGRWCLMFD